MTTCLRYAAMTMLVVGMQLGGCASWSSSDNSRQSAYTELGMGYLARGESDQARTALNKALTQNAKDPAALQGMALLEQHDGNAEASATYYQRALAALSNTTAAGANIPVSRPQVQNNYASLLFAQGRISEACAQLGQAAEDVGYAGRAGVLVNLSQCQSMAGDQDASRRTLAKARQLAPDQPTVIIAVAYQKLEDGDINGARAYLTRYQQLTGGNSREAQLLDTALTSREHPAQTSATSAHNH